MQLIRLQNIKFQKNLNEIWFGFNIYWGRIDTNEDNFEDINTKWNLNLCDLKTNLIPEEFNSFMEGYLNFQDTETKLLII